jgi:hypothetical protein
VKVAGLQDNNDGRWRPSGDGVVFDCSGMCQLIVEGAMWWYCSEEGSWAKRVVHGDGSVGP